MDSTIKLGLRCFWETQPRASPPSYWNTILHHVHWSNSSHSGRIIPPPDDSSTSPPNTLTQNSTSLIQLPISPHNRITHKHTHTRVALLGNHSILLWWELCNLKPIGISLSDAWKVEKKHLFTCGGQKYAWGPNIHNYLATALNCVCVCVCVCVCAVVYVCVQCSKALLQINRFLIPVTQIGLWQPACLWTGVYSTHYCHKLTPVAGRVRTNEGIMK